MTQYNQLNRIIKIQTDLPENSVVATRIHGCESINDLFKYTVAVVSSDTELTGKQLLGSTVTLSIHKDNNKSRYINGHIIGLRRNDLNNRDGRAYDLIVAPWCFFLTKRTNCRIFQNKSVLDIAEALFKEQGYDAYSQDIQAQPPKREYTVQYNETDWHFIARLLAEEGINFFFTHINGKHTLVMSDHNNAFQPAFEKEVSYHSGSLEEDHIYQWTRQESFISGKFISDAYDFTTPNKPLKAMHHSKKGLKQYENAEQFRYWGDYNDRSVGETRLLRQLESEEANFDVTDANSRCRSFAAGLVFKLNRHDSKGELGEYIITSMNLSAHEPSYANSNDLNPRYDNSFECQPKDSPIRPENTLSKPMINGSHRAIVVGPESEEIYTDKYGRVKVQFKWDRYRKGNDKDSCWLRVNQHWAGNGFGAQFIPRVGSEVIVEFFQGDIDQPYVAGCLYNGEQSHPFELPKNKTQSGIKTLTSKDANGFNALRFEDKQGEEEIFIHGEKDYRKVIKHDAYEDIGHNAERHVAKNQIIAIDKNRHETVGEDSNLTVKKDRSEEIGADSKTKVDGRWSLEIDGDTLSQHNSNFSQKTKSKHSVEADTVVIQGSKEVTLRVGSSEIVLTPKSIDILAAALIKQKAGMIEIN